MLLENKIIRCILAFVKDGNSMSIIYFYHGDGLETRFILKDHDQIL